ncbi:polysaccharide deacetylase family protein [Phaeovulum sp.]|uniref:polysaccharide deacetylase family protein n=1 Tax=Phaeovulum sp. TaxID=2934796 RepID=UPI0035648165
MTRRNILGGALSGALTAGLGLRADMARASDPADLPIPVLTEHHDVVLVNSVLTDKPFVALTFDDGPHPVHTPRLLDILRAHGATATFYVVGQMVRRYPDVVKRIADEGHEIGNHTWSHADLLSLGDSDVLREIDRANEAIWRATGHLPVTMRPPYGAITSYQSRMLHENRLLPTVMWSVDPSDYRRPGADVVASRIVTKARGGSIVLAHDIHAPTVDAMPAALEGLAAAGLQATSMSQLLGWRRWGKVQMVSQATPARSRGHEDD